MTTLALTDDAALAGFPALASIQEQTEAAIAQRVRREDLAQPVNYVTAIILARKLTEQIVAYDFDDRFKIADASGDPKRTRRYSIREVTWYEGRCGLGKNGFSIRQHRFGLGQRHSAHVMVRSDDPLTRRPLWDPRKPDTAWDFANPPAPLYDLRWHPWCDVNFATAAELAIFALDAQTIMKQIHARQRQAADLLDAGLAAADHLLGLTD